MKGHHISVPKMGVAILVAGYFFYYAATTDSWHFLDNVNLIIHEGGHTLALAFPETIYIFAGSFTQVATPLIFSLYFDYQANYFASSLLLFWVGQSLMNVSVYIKDAVVMQLPLLGGDSSIHDWNYLLTQWNELSHAGAIGSAVFGMGLAVIIIATALSLYNSTE